MAEDSEEDERLFLDVFKRSGLVNPVIVVSHGADAIAYLQGAPLYADRDRFPRPSILLLDLAMPKVDGWEVLKWVKSRPELNNLLIVVLTASLRVADLQRAYQMGAHSFLGKPCKVQELLNLEKAYPKHWTRDPHPAQSTATESPSLQQRAS
jgi:CheY-like chemotaxis protein